MNRVPNEKQYRMLLALGSGSACVTMNKRPAEMYLRRGWVTADKQHEKGYYVWIRITPDGLRALADAVEKYGLPEILPSKQKQAA